LKCFKEKAQNNHTRTISEGALWGWLN